MEKANDRDFPYSLWTLPLALDNSADSTEAKAATTLALAAVEYSTRGDYPDRLTKSAILGEGLRQGYKLAVDRLQSPELYGPDSVREEGWFIIVSL